MSISRKVLWIFLSILFMIFALGLTIMIYQASNTRMHDVLHKLIIFNNSVHQLQKSQEEIAIEDNTSTAFNIEHSLGEMKSASKMLLDALGDIVVTEMSLASITDDIDNYHKAIDEFIEQNRHQTKLKKDMLRYGDRLHHLLYVYEPQSGYDYHALERQIFLLNYSTTPENLIKLKTSAHGANNNLTDERLHRVIDQILLTSERIYVTSLALKEREDYLKQTAENFMGITKSLSDSLQRRDKRLTRNLGAAATLISGIAIAIILVYWSMINKYVRRFLARQSEVMEVIKTKSEIKDIPPMFVNDELGELTRQMWVMANELYEKDKELIRSENKYKTYINTTPLAVIVHDSRKKLVDVNEGAVKMFGYNRSELLQKTLDDIWVEDVTDELKEYYEKSEEETNITFMRKLKHKNDKTLYASVSAVRLSEDRFLGFCLNITERVRLEKELKKINEGLLEKVKEEVDKNMKQDQIIQQQKKLVDMGMMVSAIAHQWRQPLNALALCVQDVRDEFEVGNMSDEYLENYENHAMQLIAHMSKTIDDFRDFFLPDKNVTEFDVIHVVSDLIRLLNVQIYSKNIDISLECICNDGEKHCNGHSEKCKCDNVYGKVIGYPGEFKQVVINLIYNSVDAIIELREEGKLDRGSIKVVVTSEKEFITLTVGDNGAGIEESVIEHIFEPYFTTKIEGKGTGIGLYMSKAIIENHMQGKIYAEQQTEGACFVIELPTANATG